MRTHAALVLVLLTGSAAAVRGQGPVRTGAPADSTSLPAVFHAPDAMPGSIVSVAVRVPAHAGAASAQFQVRAGTAVMLYGPAHGELVWTTSESVLPLTFSVPRDEAAGIMHIAHVLVAWADGTRWIADVQTRVGVRRGLELQLDTSSLVVARGRTSRVGFTLRNAGNATDTVALSFFKPTRWTASAPPVLTLEPGAVHHGAIEIGTPGDATLGETQIVRLAATGLGSEAAANVSIEVASNLDNRASWVRLPATVVIGLADASAVGEAPFALGLDARGPVGYGTDASLFVRHSPYGYTSPAFQRHLAGPSVRAELRHGDQRISAGDVLLGGSPLLGNYMQANGFDAQLQVGAVRTTAFAARPFQLDAPHRAGHLLSARSEVPVGSGALGIAVADLDRPYGVGDATERTQLATASYQGDLLAGLSARAEAGFMRLEDVDGRTRSGLSVDVQSRYHDTRVDLTARFRRVPGALATSGSAVDESFVSGTIDVGSGLSVNGWAVHTSAALLDGRGSSRDGAALGLRWGGGAAAARITANHSSTDGSGIAGSQRRRSLTLGGTAGVGPLVLDGTLEVGNARTRDLEQPLRSASARLSYQHGGASAWIGSSHSLGLFGTNLHRVDAGSSIRTRRIEFDGSVGTYLGDGDAQRNLNAWLSTLIHADARTSFIVGLDYSPWNPDHRGLRISLGARRSFGLPLPLRRHAVVEGTVFDDRNGNLVRDTGEPPLADVSVRRGAMRTRTDARGHYVFFDDTPVVDDLRVDVASLGAGLLLPPDVPLRPVGRVDVPVHRAASLHLSLFNDANGDGMRDAAERPAAERTAEVIDARGRTRIATADENGDILFRALSPGRYTVRGFARDGLRTVPGKPITVLLEPATATEIPVPVPFSQVEIRFRTEPPAPDTTLTTILGMASTGNRVSLPATRRPSSTIPTPDEASGADAQGAGRPEASSAEPANDPGTAISRASALRRPTSGALTAAPDGASTRPARDPAGVTAIPARSVQVAVPKAPDPTARARMSGWAPAAGLLLFAVALAIALLAKRRRRDQA